MAENILLQMPYSTFFIFGLSLALGLTTSMVNRRMVNFEKVRAFRKKMSEISKEMKEVRKKGNKRAYAKLQRKRMVLMRESQQVMGGQFKVMLFTTVPFMLIFILMYNYVFTPEIIVAFSPVYIPWWGFGPDNTHLTFWGWYFLAALAVNMPINRIFRIYGY